MPTLPLPHVIQLTPPGRGAVATLRVEGPGALEAVQTHFRSRGGRLLSDSPADQWVVGHFGGDCAEEVVVRRHTDGAVELHCHGGLAAVAMIEKTLIVAGCRLLAWRDWASDHLVDPVAAAALVALADAPTERTAAILLDQYHGALRRTFDEIQQTINASVSGGQTFLSVPKSAIDKDRQECLSSYGRARQQIDILLARAELGRHLVEPWRVVLAGRVNAGKSSLINALAGFGRSIVHSTPGTTRDAVTVTTAIDGWPVELCDTAGLRVGGDAIERAGIQLAQERLDRADLAVLVLDSSKDWSAEDQRLVDQWPKALLIHNKSDLPTGTGKRPAGLWTSALRGDGMDAVLDTVARRLVPEPPKAGAAVPFTTEQMEEVQCLSNEIARRASRDRPDSNTAGRPARYCASD